MASHHLLHLIERGVGLLLRGNVQAARNERWSSGNGDILLERKLGNLRHCLLIQPTSRFGFLITQRSPERDHLFRSKPAAVSRNHLLRDIGERHGRSLSRLHSRNSTNCLGQHWGTLCLSLGLAQLQRTERQLLAGRLVAQLVLLICPVLVQHHHGVPESRLLLGQAHVRELLTESGELVEHLPVGLHLLGVARDILLGDALGERPGLHVLLDG